MFREFLIQLHYLPQTIIISSLCVMACLFLRENKGRTIEKLKELIKHDGWTALFILYSAILITSTVLARSFTNPLHNVIGQFGIIHDGRINFDALENTLAFVPYTFLYLMAFKLGAIWKRSFLLTLVTTLFIEFSQLVFSLGWFQLSDIVHNILGGMIGSGLWFLWKKRFLSRGFKRFSAIVNKQQ